MRPILLLLVCLANLKVLSQGNPAQEGKVLLEQSRQLRKGQKPAEAMVAARAALGLLKKADSPALLGQAYFNLSEQYSGNFADTTIHIRHAYLDSATGPLKAAGRIELLAESYRLMADLDHLISQLDKALQEANVALRYYESIHYVPMQGIYVLFAKLHYIRGDYQQSLQYGLKALERAEATKDSSMRLCEI